jgi:hypothetical protein
VLDAIPCLDTVALCEIGVQRRVLLLAMSPKASISSKAASKGQEQQAHKKNDKYKFKANKYKLKLKALKVSLGRGSTALWTN